MKNFIVVLVLFFVLFSDHLLAQIQKGNKELALTASFMSRKYERADESWELFNMAMSFGYFITDGLEIEPEIMISAYEEEYTGWIGSVNVSYNFQTGNSNVTPFFLVGIGYSNTILYFPKIPYIGDGNENWSVLNAGAGLKIFLSDPVSLRLEYRYQKFDSDFDYTNNIVLLGISAFIK